MVIQLRHVHEPVSTKLSKTSEGPHWAPSMWMLLAEPASPTSSVFEIRSFAPVGCPRTEKIIAPRKVLDPISQSLNISLNCFSEAFLIIAAMEDLGFVPGSDDLRSRLAWLGDPLCKISIRHLLPADKNRHRGSAPFPAIVGVRASLGGASDRQLPQYAGRSAMVIHCALDGRD
jgi:hypothetical protein